MRWEHNNVTHLFNLDDFLDRFNAAGRKHFKRQGHHVMELGDPMFLR